MCPLGRATIDEGDGAKAKSTRQVGQARANICRPCVLQVLNGSLPHSKSTALDANATPQPFRPPRRRLPSIRRVVVQAMGHGCHHSLHTSWGYKILPLWLNYFLCICSTSLLSDSASTYREGALSKLSTVSLLPPLPEVATLFPLATLMGRLPGQ